MASAFSNYVTHLVIILYGFWNVNCFLPIFCIFLQTASPVLREIQTTYVFTRNPIRDTGSAPGSAPPAWPLLPPFFDPSPQGFLLLSPADNHPFQPQAVFR